MSTSRDDLIDGWVEVPILLGRAMAQLKPGSTYWPVLGELYNTLSIAQQIICQKERKNCQKAIRGEVLAELTDYQHTA